MDMIFRIGRYLNWKVTAGIVSVAGILSGEIALNSARDAQPPMTWMATGIVGVFAIIAPTILFGLQLLKKNKTDAYRAWMFFFFNAIHLLAMGLSALVISLIQGVFDPPSMIFAVFGAGLSVSLMLTKSSCYDSHKVESTDSRRSSR